MLNRLWILLCLLVISCALTAQEGSSNTDDGLVSKYIKAINTKADRLDQKLDKHTAKALAKMKKQEAGIKRKLERSDSLKAASILGNADDEYVKLEQRLGQIHSIKQYIPSFDTLTTSLKFLQQNPGLSSGSKEAGNVQETFSKINNLGSKFEKAEEVKRFLKERKQYLKAQLQSLGFAKQIKKLNKQVYYYGEQLNEYKSILKDHKKAERKALDLLSKSKPFQNFMRKNSMLASLFRMPGDPNDPGNPPSLAGLQTRAQVNNLIQQQIGTNGQAQFQQNMQDAQSQLQSIKNKIQQMGGTSSDEEWPEGFKPNNQKTKGFLKRWEMGFNIQSQKANNYFPVATDLGLSLGYKLNDRSVLGIGASYRVGWGQNIRHIKITQQGVGLRSFVDWKIKGSFWLSGGYETNYRSEFRNIEELKDLNAWQQSGLIGVSKVISLKTKFFKKTKIQLLWDYLSYQQKPRTQPIIFRINYSLK